MKLNCTYLLILLSISSSSIGQEDIISNKKKDDASNKSETIISNSQKDNSSKSEKAIIIKSSEQNSSGSKEEIIGNKENQDKLVSNEQESSLKHTESSKLNICNCWNSLFAQKKSDYSKAFSEMENTFISKGYLDSSNSESYLGLMKVFADSNDYFPLGVDINPMLFLGFKKCFILNNCDSSYYSKIRNMNEKIASYEYITPRQAYTDIQKVFSAEDLENSLIRHYVLTFYPAAFFTTFNVEELQDEKEEENVAETEELKPIVTKNILFVHAAAEDKIFVDDSLVDIKDLKKMVYKHISDTVKAENSPEINQKYIEGLGMRKVSKQSITFTTDDNTSYEFSVFVKETIEETYNVRRNEIAEAEFGSSYDDLIAHRKDNIGKIRVVHNLLKVKITEVEESE